ncbi:hypothetical protein BD414DRAFT_454349 [Trametes punicea]|nr:hypothetical protein BD414DRAFT_454349 [Trametes punicea]
MSGRCEECGATTEWDPDLGSAICLQCGTLADPTQSVFTSHLDYVDTSAREFVPWSNVPGMSTLRGRNGRVLGGQDKEARDRRNTISMHEFIRGIAGRLSNSGSISRAQGIFDQAMSRGRYRWGRRAKLTAGAALAIALRESRKSASIRDIAYLLDEPPVAVSRAFSAVVDLLGLKLSTADPAVHLPTLQTHLMSLVDGTQADHALPAQLTKVLPTLVPQLPSVMRTANALSGLLERTHTLAHLPTPPTACALLMLALEAEHGSSLPHAGALAQALGARVGAGKGVVMQRYKLVYDLVEEWIREVPWLDAHERRRAKGREGEGRSKIAKRVVVARGLKDVVQFQEEIWRKRVEGAGRPLLDLDVEEGGDEKDEDGDVGGWGIGGRPSSSRASRAPSGSGSEVRSGAQKSKRAKTRHPKSIVDASHFLLNPLSSSSSAFPSASLGPAPTPTPTTARSSGHEDRERAPSASGAAEADLLTHLLTADASSLAHAFRAAPSRLQLLAAVRGGADETHVADEELFEGDELEGMMRSPEEVEAVRIAMGWDLEGGDGDEVEAEAFAGVTGKGKGRARPVGSKRINMDALARLLDPDADVDMESLARDEEEGVMHLRTEDESVDEEEEEEEEDSVGTAYGVQEPSADAEEVMVMEEWRPMSPDGAVGSVEDWYDF